MKGERAKERWQTSFVKTISDNRRRDEVLAACHSSRWVLLFLVLVVLPFSVREFFWTSSPKTYEQAAAIVSKTLDDTYATGVFVDPPTNKGFGPADVRREYKCARGDSVPAGGDIRVDYTSNSDISSDDLAAFYARSFAGAGWLGRQTSPGSYLYDKTIDNQKVEIEWEADHFSGQTEVYVVGGLLNVSVCEQP